MNSDYFVSLGTFTLSDCIYFTEKFLSSLNPQTLYQIFKLMNMHQYKFLRTEREERICLAFQKQVIIPINQIPTLFYWEIVNKSERNMYTIIWLTQLLRPVNPIINRHIR